VRLKGAGASRHWMAAVAARSKRESGLGCQIWQSQWPLGRLSSAVGLFLSGGAFWTVGHGRSRERRWLSRYTSWIVERYGQCDGGLGSSGAVSMQTYMKAKITVRATRTLSASPLPDFLEPEILWNFQSLLLMCWYIYIHQEIHEISRRYYLTI
jgi:hypothetical protein